MLLLPAPLMNKPYSPQHKEYQACTSILTPLTNRLQTLLVVYLVKLCLTLLKDDTQRPTNNPSPQMNAKLIHLPKDTLVIVCARVVIS